MVVIGAAWHEKRISAMADYYRQVLKGRFEMRSVAAIGGRVILPTDAGEATNSQKGPIALWRELHNEEVTSLVF